ncbi:MAG: efflux RND transporter periplasmic adaptor subunit [Sandaracinus sp.]
MRPSSLVLAPLALAVLPFALALSACEHEVQADAPVEEAPYALADDGAMIVRDDLASHLVTARATTSGVSAQLVGFGRLGFAPGASYTVRVPFAGYVQDVFVAAGADVRVGTPLATIRSSDLARLRAESRGLSAQIAAQRDSAERLQRLIEQGAASPRELVEVQGELTANEAQLAGIREALAAARTTASGSDLVQLRATGAGQVLTRTIEPGERVSPEDADAAFSIGDTTQLVLYAQFPERDATLLQTGASCSFTASALGGASFEGVVTRVIQRVDRATRTTEIACDPTAMDPRFRPEMTARVQVQASGSGDAVVVPRAAVLLRRDDRVVIVRREDGRLERRTVHTGSVLGDEVIVDGVQAGEEVVVEGAVLLDGELDQLI